MPSACYCHCLLLLMGGVLSKPVMDQAPPASQRINLQMAFFDPFKDEQEFQSAQKQKILRTAFMVFYVDELRESLKRFVAKYCQHCNQDIGGKAAPIFFPHSCSEYQTMRDAYEEYGGWC